MEKVAIVGVGMTKIEANKVSERFEDMVFEATRKALDDCGMDIKDVGNVITASNDFWDGRTISCMAVGDAQGVREKNASCTEGDGTFGAFYGMTRILSGAYPSTLVTGHSKGSESVSSLITNAVFDPIYERSLGVDMVTGCAMQARAYMEATGATAEDFARVSVKNHKNAMNNPLAQLPMDISVQDVLDSEMIADPLHKLDCSPVSDGACALILADEATAKKLAKKPVWLKGVSFCSDAYFLGDRDLAKSPSLEKAAQKAYAMAGISDPGKDIDVAQVYDAFSYQELMWLEGLGLADYGKAKDHLAAGDFDVSGALPVNTAGGLLSGHPVIAAGLYLMAEAVRQLRGEADNQVEGARTAVVQGVNGVAGQSHCVWVLSSE
ncbi:MAG: thiolase family protein [Deltaproteobacteria bacterium]|nr:thiolase family protein [Deltaproteobacteria bacterium]